MLPPPGPRALIAVVSVVSVLTLAACTGEDEGATPASPPGTVSPTTFGDGAIVYAALGDSYSAAPYVPETDPDDPCLRSDGNYAHLVAEELGAELRDVTCGGATTESLTTPTPALREEVQPAQLDVVTDDVDLVTIGIGGNDFGLYGAAIYQCAQLAPSDPEGDPCSVAATQSGADSEANIRQIGERIADVLSQVRSRAPDAQVLLVGYPRLVPDDGECAPEVFPLATGDYPLVREIFADLDAAMRGAAQATEGVEYVDVRAASEGHDMCAEDPWVNGAVRDVERAAEYHPLPVEQRAVADLVLDLVDD